MPEGKPFSIPVDSLLKHTSSGSEPEGFSERLLAGEINQSDVFFLFAMAQSYMDQVTQSPAHKGKLVSHIRDPHPGIEKIKVFLSED